MPFYLHGFASGPKSKKATRFAELGASVGMPIVTPALDEGDFTGLSVTRMLAYVERLVAAEPGPLVLFGSSLGGYVASLYASRHPVAALVLMAPAVDYARRLTDRTDPATLERWRRTGAIDVFHFAHLREMPIGYQLIDDARNHEPFPRVGSPVLVMQGLQDPVVPHALVETWARGLPQATYVPYETGHEMTDLTDVLFERARAFLASVPEVAARWPGLVR